MNILEAEERKWSEIVKKKTKGFCNFLGRQGRYQRQQEKMQAANSKGRMGNIIIEEGQGA